MVQYATPGLYVEETRAGRTRIEGADTSTAGFVGLTRCGPIGVAPPLLTSSSDFEQLYGSTRDLVIGGVAVANTLAHAAHAFFENGGRRLHVARVLGAGATSARAMSSVLTLSARQPGGGTIDGSPSTMSVVFDIDASAKTKGGMRHHPPGTLVRVGTEVAILAPNSPMTIPSAFERLAEDAAVTVLTLSVHVTDADHGPTRYANLGFDPAHPRNVLSMLGATSPDPFDALACPLVLTAPAGIDALALYAACAATGRIDLSGGSDGTGPPTDSDWQEALHRLEAIEDVAIIAAPGASAFPAPTPAAVNAQLIAAAETTGACRVAVLDPPPNFGVADLITMKAALDSPSAALYCPWIGVTDSAGPDPLFLPPSGFVCGIYARTDAKHGVFKTPANTVVSGAIALQHDFTNSEQAVLDPLGINCIRTIVGHGIRVWGARTLSSDPEQRYLNVRRYVLYLDASIERGTRWAAFEPNGAALWTAVQASISAFLGAEWRNGGLRGATQNDAFFVHCDRTTMTQNDLDNGRLVCLAGVAARKPAEFTIFRIVQPTADVRP